MRASEAKPPLERVAAGPIRSAINPKMRNPAGADPMNDIVKKLITRPRFESSTVICKKVLIEAVQRRREEPRKKRKNPAKIGIRDQEKRMSRLLAVRPAKKISRAKRRPHIRVER